MLKDLKALWASAFDSKTSYTNLFFDYLYSKENVRFVKADDKVVSAVYTLPYDINIKGEKIPFAYMCGVATDSEYRGRGIVSDLIKRSFYELYNEGIALCGLIPMNDGLFGFYERFGFSSVYRLVKTEFKKTGESLLELRPLTEYEDCARLYNEKIAVNDFSLFMPPEHFDFLSKESRMFSENPLAVYNNGAFSGYIFYTKATGTDLVREVVTGKVSVNDTVNALCRDYNIDKVTVYTPSFYGFEGEKASVGMLRIIDVKKVLEAFYSKKEEVSFIITDDIIPQNNGYFSVSGGTATKGFGEKADFHFNITELMNFLVKEDSPFDPYINMLLN